MNFVQKGDCYDISKKIITFLPDIWYSDILFTVDNKEGAMKKPWIDKTEDLSGCEESCSKDENCGHQVTVNIDLKNVNT